MTRRIRRRILQVIVLLGLLAGFLIYRGLQPTGKAWTYYRVEKATAWSSLLPILEEKGYLRSALVAGYVVQAAGRKPEVGVGTYRLDGTKPAWEVIRALGHPIRQNVRMPETNWARRNANLLLKAQVTTVEDYMAEVANTTDRKTDFPLPAASLEGYLYPDTYDFPPLLGAKGVVGRQLEAFRRKVWEPLQHPKDLDRLIKVASLVELEVARDNERPIVAGVIENRLKLGMPLQIDASINYGLQKWRPLTRRDYKEVDSLYNLYLHKGLPPTPICSPSIKSIEAALHPAQHDYLYYVALPSGESLFAATYDAHKQNIKKRKAALEALKK